MRTKLLLADDSITIQKVVGIIFASEDYELAIADSGAAVLAKAREFGPDLLLVDAVMPGKTGYEVCEEVRRDAALKGIPILLLTGAFEPFDDDKARQCGADDFISKPFESQHLIDKVTELLDLGRQRALAAPVSAAAPSEPEMPASRAPQPAPAVAAPSTQPAAGGPDFFSMEPEPAPISAPAAPPAAAHDFELELVEGTTDDDLWGAFDLEDEAEGETADFDESFAVEPLAESESVAGETFGFADEAEPAPPEPADAAEGFAAQWGTGADADFSFAEEEPPVFSLFDAEKGDFIVEAGGTPHDLAGIKPYTPPAEQEFDLQFAPEEDFMVPPETLQSPPPVPSPAVAAPEPMFAPEEEYVPAPEALAPVPAPAAGGATVSEEQLQALVARISRDLIEKIAWEVVPDLAETIIKEEIRKIKEGA